MTAGSVVGSQVAAPARIVFEVHPQVAGGTEHFLRGLLRRLDRQRFEPMVVAPAAGPTLVLFEADGIPGRIVPWASADGETELTTFLRQMGVALAQSSYFSTALALAAARTGVPHVWRMGGHIDVVHAGKSPREKSVFLGLVSCLSRVVVCGSEFLRRQFDGVGATNLEVIPNGVDLDEFEPVAESAQRSHVTVAMVGHLVAQKRHADFVRAAALVAAAVPGVRFRIVGAPYDSLESRRYASEIVSLVEALGLTGRLELSEVRRERGAALRDVDLFVLPSEAEGASNAVLEAMALGRPVVASRSGGNPELVQDGVSGLLVPLASPDRLAEAILRLVRDPEVARRFGQAGRKRAEASFDLRACRQGYERLYTRVLAGSA